jgi:hypothetical protein
VDALILGSTRSWIHWHNSSAVAVPAEGTGPLYAENLLSSAGGTLEDAHMARLDHKKSAARFAFSKYGLASGVSPWDGALR